MRRAHIALYNALKDLASDRRDARNGYGSRALPAVSAVAIGRADISDLRQLEESISRVRHQRDLVPEDLLAIKIHFYQRVRSFFGLNEVQAI